MLLKNRKVTKEKQEKVNTPKEAEDSISFRVLITLTVMVGISSTVLVSEDGLFTGIITIVLTSIGSYVSYMRRRSKNWWIKLLISLGMLVTFADFLRNVSQNPYDPRIPLANLLIWLQVLHSFDLPKRKDLGYSLITALILISVTATISRDMYFGIFLLLFSVFSLMSLLYNNLSQHNISKLVIKKKTTFKIGLPAILVTLIGMGGAFLLIPRSQTMKVKSLPISIKLPEIPNFQGEIRSKTSKEIRTEMKNGKKTISIKRNFNEDAYYGFTTELDLNFRGKLSDETVMKVRSSEARNWRGMAFDTYDGKTWKMSFPNETKKIWTSTPPMYLRLAEQISRDLTSKRELIQTFYIEKEQSNLVFSAIYADELYFPSNYVLTDLYGSVRSPVELQEGLTYSVISRIPEYNLDTLRSIEPITQNMKVSNTFIQVPPISDRVIKLAYEVTKKANNNFDKLVLLHDYLKTNYNYNLNIPEFPENAETIDYFLFKQKEGYCEHFATSFSVMARTLGIPTRLVTGFTSGKYNRITGYYEVKSSDAHAWVEAYFPYQGWVEFDPTPGYVINPLQSERNDGVIAKSFLTQLWNKIKELIPPSVKNFFENILKDFLISIFNLFIGAVKLVFKLDWFSFVAVIMAMGASVLAFVWSFSIFKKFQLRKKEETALKMKFDSDIKIEAFKLQKNFISKLTKLGYEWKDYYTLKEYIEEVSTKNIELKEELNKLLDFIYEVRYGNKNIEISEIENYKTNLDIIYDKISKKVQLLNGNTK